MSKNRKNGRKNRNGGDKVSRRLFVIDIENLCGKPVIEEADVKPAKRRSEVKPEEPKRYTYMDCLRGTVPLPKHVNGATIFQVLMVGCMVTFMVTVNGVRNTGLDFLVNSHWLYPLMFCLAFLVRTFYGAPVVNKLAPKLVFSHFEGAARGIAMTVLNVCCMAPVMCAIATLLIVGIDDYLMHYLATLPIVAPMALLVNYFIVGPIVKLVFANHISPSGGLGLLGNLEQNAPNLARLLGC